MGNSSTSDPSSSSPSSSSASFSSMTNFSSNTSHPFGGVSFFDITHMMMMSISDMMHNCHDNDSRTVALGLQIFIVITALLANSALMWLLFKSRHNLSPSQLLAFNISIVDVLYCLCLPFDLYVTLDQTLEILHNVRESLSVLKVFACPLFLTLMCLERYIAAVFPITFLQLGKWKHRIILCVVAWVLILFLLVLHYYFQSFSFVLSLAVVMVLLFLIMLLCLAGIMCVLCQSGPGDGASSGDSLKKRALGNIIMVIVPSAMAYLPLVVLVGYLALAISKGAEMSRALRRTTVLSVTHSTNDLLQEERGKYNLSNASGVEDGGFKLEALPRTA